MWILEILAVTALLIVVFMAISCAVLTVIGFVAESIAYRNSK